MNNKYFFYYYILIIGPLSILLSGCESVDRKPKVVQPKDVVLQGCWQYDSAGASFYNSQYEFINKFMDSMAGSVLTIGSTTWVYTGNVQEEHIYSRVGDTVITQRKGYTTRLSITELTDHRLTVQNKSTDPDSSLTRVWVYYYSRQG